MVYFHYILKPILNYFLQGEENEENMDEREHTHRAPESNSSAEYVFGTILENNMKASLYVFI